MATTSVGQQQRASGGNELKLAVLIGVGALLFLLAAWGVTRLMSDAEPKQVMPAWLNLSPVVAQTVDGRMLAVKVNLQLKNQQDVEELTPYVPAFKALVAQIGAEFRAEDSRGSERIIQFGEIVRQAVNNYLKDQHITARVKHVAFEEFRVMPS